jgi:TolB-like protein/Tfp pilus assembly protein PilF
VRYLFGDCTLDTERRELRRGSDPLSLEPQVFDLIVHLIRHRDRVVSKDELVAKIWRGRTVSGSALFNRINAARSAIGDSGDQQRLIRTLHRKGLRFVGDVRTGSDAGEPTPGAALREDELHEPKAAPPSERPVIAVLPFVNMSGEPGQEYFSDGISEDLIAALSRLRWFFVIARNSSFTYKGKAVPMKQIAEELGAGYVIEGSVRRGGDRMRVTAQLSDVATGNHIWAEHYDRELSDVFAVQDEITEAVVAAIEPQLYVAENFRARRKPPDSMDGWELVMRAVSHYWRVTREDNVAARALLEKAIAIAPNYGQAPGVLAACHVFASHMGWEDPRTALPIAERTALAAIRADDEDPWAHFALGYVYLHARRFDDALAEGELALRLNPSFALAQGLQSLTLSFAGRWEEGSTAARRALRLSPRDPFSAMYYAAASFARFVARDYEEAMRLARDALRRRSDFPGPHRTLTAAAAMAGHDDIATAALQELRRVQPDISLAWIANQLPIREAAERDHYVEAFRRAGLD